MSFKSSLSISRPSSNIATTISFPVIPIFKKKKKMINKYTISKRKKDLLFIYFYFSFNFITLTPYTSSINIMSRSVLIYLLINDKKGNVTTRRSHINHSNIVMIFLCKSSNNISILNFFSNISINNNNIIIIYQVPLIFKTRIIHF